MDIYTEGVAVMVIGMSVVFVTLVVLATFTALLERLFRPAEERVLEVSHDSLHDESGHELQEVALAAVAIYVSEKTRRRTYAPLSRVSEQWKMMGRFRSLRR